MDVKRIRLIALVAAISVAALPVLQGCGSSQSEPDSKEYYKGDLAPKTAPKGPASTGKMRNQGPGSDL